jgi:hypothetical protein
MVLSNDNVTEGAMPNKERMTIDERYKYLRMMQQRYRPATRKGRSQLLDEMECMTHLERKTLIRHMNSKIARKPRRKQRGKTYGHDVDDALRVISETLDYICAERLTPHLLPTAKALAAHNELDLSPGLLKKLERISVSTVRRRLKKFARLEQGRLPRRQGPRQRNPVTRNIPTKRIPWDEQQPGHFEVDLVHHCGPSPSGHYVHTMQMIDVATGWSERAAVLGRGQLVMEDAFRRILRRLPFAVREIHPDNGSEFFNHHLVRFWKDAVKGVRLSRSRPWHKNDNRFVEQKNATLVRAYLGDARFDSVDQTNLLNQLYQKMWLPKVQLLPTGDAHDRENDHPYSRPRPPRTPQLRHTADALPTALRYRCHLRHATSPTPTPTRRDQSSAPSAADLRVPGPTLQLARRDT